MVRPSFLKRVQVLLQVGQFFGCLFPDELGSPPPFSVYVTQTLLLQMSLMFLPEKLPVLLANAYKSQFESCFAYLLKISARECLSGRAKFTARSILLNMAGSRSLFRFVAQISSTFVLDSKLSIFLKSVERILRLASCISVFLLPARASISSMKMMTFPSCQQSSHIWASFVSLSPQYLLMIASVGMQMSGMLTCWAIIFALVVFPVPGGPSNSTAFGRFGSYFMRVLTVIQSQISGQLSAKSTVSSISLFWFQQPARQSQSRVIVLSLGSNTVNPSSFNLLINQFPFFFLVWGAFLLGKPDAGSLILIFCFLGLTTYLYTAANALQFLSVIRSSLLKISLKFGRSCVIIPVRVSLPLCGAQLMQFYSCIQDHFLKIRHKKLQDCCWGSQKLSCQLRENFCRSDRRSQRWR